MVETPGIVVITKFVRSSSNVFSSYIKYMDRDEAVNGGAIHSSYSAYSEEYMGNPEKTTGLFSMDYDQLSEEIAQIYKEQFEQAQKNGSLLWQTVVSFDNKWLEELGIYDPESQVLDEVRIRGAVRLFMKTLLDKEELHLAAWTAAVHYNTDNIHVHIAVVDPTGERKLVKDGQYAGEPKGTWGIRSIRYAKSAAVNELLDLDQTMKRLNDLIRQSIVKHFGNRGGKKWFFRMIWRSYLRSWSRKYLISQNGSMDFQIWHHTEKILMRLPIDGCNRCIRSIGVRFKKLGTHWKSSKNVHMEKAHESKHIA